jgi:hypothetical protein
VTITRPCAARIDAAAFRVERAQRGFDRRLRAVAAHIGWLKFAHAEVTAPYLSQL